MQCFLGIRRSASLPLQEVLPYLLTQHCVTPSGSTVSGRDTFQAQIARKNTGKRMKSVRENPCNPCLKVFVLLADFLQQLVHSRLELRVLTLDDGLGTVEYQDIGLQLRVFQIGAVGQAVADDRDTEYQRAVL